MSDGDAEESQGTSLGPRFRAHPLPQCPTVVTVVSHLNSIRTIVQCIERLASQTYPVNRHRIIVVDAGSTDGSIEAVRQLNVSNLELVVEQQCTEAQGQNLGARRSDADVIFYTNSDVYVPSDWIERHVRWQAEGYPIVGGRVAWGGDRYAFSWNYPNWARVDHGITPGRGLGFGNASIRRDLYERCGGIHEIHPHQDMEFVLRAISMGARMVLDPEIVVYHDHPFESLRGSLLRSFQYTNNHLTVARGFYGQLSPGAASPLAGPNVVLPAFLKELLGVTGYRAFRDWRQVGRDHSIDIGLLEFLFLRFAGRLPGYVLGVIHSLIRPQTIAPYKSRRLSS